MHAWAELNAYHLRQRLDAFVTDHLLKDRIEFWAHGFRSLYRPSDDARKLHTVRLSPAMYVWHKTIGGVVGMTSPWHKTNIQSPQALRRCCIGLGSCIVLPVRRCGIRV